MTELSLFDIPRLFGYQFFQFALIGGMIAALSCAWIGVFLILRKESMLGDGIAHTSFGGIALGLMLGIEPLITTLIFAILAMLGIAYMRKKGLAQSDSAIAVMYALGFAFGLILISLSGGFNVELFSYLFGDVLTIDLNDLIIVTTLGIITILFLGVFYKELLTITFDEEQSRLMGIPVRTLSVVYNILVAFTIVISIKVIGIILVVALIVLPGLSALQLELSFRGTTLAAIGFGMLSIFSGIMLSAIYDVATSGIIVFMAAIIFVWTSIYRRLE